MAMRATRRWMAGSVLAVVAGAAVASAFEASKGQWSLATDVQKYYQCLPFSWYLVTPVDEYLTPERGELVQFRTPPAAVELTGTYEVIKIVAAVPGDQWQIHDDQLYINDRWWGGLYRMTALGAEHGSLDGEGVVPEGAVYVLGTNPSSYDSRYWGPLPMAQISGRAHVLF